MKLPAVIFILFALSPFASAWAANPMEGSGLPVPRFASLKSDNAFVRTGPSMDYPIKWIYKRSGLPVEIVQEYDAWRKIKDPSGETGWVHKLLLSGNRTVIIESKQPVKAFVSQEQEKLVALLEPGTVNHVEECEQTMCLLKFGTYEGWAEKKFLWGVYGSEIFN